MARRSAMLAPAVAALALAGCGTSDTDKAKSAASGFYNALRTGDGKKACSLLTPAEAQSVPSTGGAGGGPPSCAAGISALGQGFPEANVQSAKVNGKSATVVLRSSQGLDITVELQKTSGGWRVASFH